MHIHIIGIHKKFGTVHANNGISLEIKPGTILGLLGENGAGKSTLVKILAGVVQKDRGGIVLDGVSSEIRSPAEAIKLGIGLLHQDPHDFPSLSIAENLRVGVRRKAWKEQRELQRLDSIQSQLEFHINLNQQVADLTLGERQQLELLRLLWNDAELLILDEPTTGISRNQKELLFSALRKLSKQGKSIIFVSHKLEEIQDLCTQVAVLRKGELTGVLDKPFSEEQLVNLMFGRVLTRTNPCRKISNENCVEVEDLAIENSRIQLSNINFGIREGEVIGLAGMEGSGQNHFLRVLAGLAVPQRGKIRLNSHALPLGSCFRMQGEGIFFMPAGRLEEALLPGMTLYEHFYLSNEEVPFFVDRKNILSRAREKIEQFNIKGDSNSLVEELSGGNQQRLVLALQKEKARLMLLEYPTRGLDIESANWIWKILRRRCEKGVSIIFSSQDLDELLFYADRIVVFYGNQVSKPIQASRLDENMLGSMIGGKNWQKI